MAIDLDVSGFQRVAFAIADVAEPDVRTTLAIDDDVLIAAKALVRHQGRSVGAVVSELARSAMGGPRAEGSRNGIPRLSSRSDSPLVTLGVVNALRDELP